jgi:hypothetical protein
MLSELLRLKKFKQLARIISIYLCHKYSLPRLKRHERDSIFCVVINDCFYNVTVNSEELIGTTERLTI